ncbi:MULTISPECIES: hypothetical protein [unclassified Rhodococcus (in: high G+C Gram-positive bacteria)]|nr:MULTISPECIES: hypothetical protein [unclassified Rhodococcus (in: high G+C Gram-positive bacteria)]
MWVVRDWHYAEQSTRLRAELGNAAKEFNTYGAADTEPLDWRRRVGIWCD